MKNNAVSSGRNFQSPILWLAEGAAGSMTLTVSSPVSRTVSPFAVLVCNNTLRPSSPGWPSTSCPRVSPRWIVIPVTSVFERFVLTKELERAEFDFDGLEAGACSRRRELDCLRLELGEEIASLAGIGSIDSRGKNAFA